MNPISKLTWPTLTLTGLLEAIIAEPDVRGCYLMLPLPTCILYISGLVPISRHAAQSCDSCQALVSCPSGSSSALRRQDKRTETIFLSAASSVTPALSFSPSGVVLTFLTRRLELWLVQALRRFRTMIGQRGRRRCHIDVIHSLPFSFFPSISSLIGSPGFRLLTVSDLIWYLRKC